MHRSYNRILTTHVGSLPRPPALRDLLIRYERGENIDRAEFQRQIEAAVRRVVVKQLAVGMRGLYSPPLLYWFASGIVTVTQG